MVLWILSIWGTYINNDPNDPSTTQILWLSQGFYFARSANSFANLFIIITSTRKSRCALEGGLVLILILVFRSIILFWVKRRLMILPRVAVSVNIWTNSLGRLLFRWTRWLNVKLSLENDSIFIEVGTYLTPLVHMEGSTI